MLDSNTFYLNEYQHYQEIVERNWEMNKATMRENVVGLAYKIMLQDVDTDTFNLAFQDYVDDDYKFELLLSWLDDIEKGNCEKTLKDSLIIEALDAAVFCLYDCEIEEILEDDESYGTQIRQMVMEVGL